MVDVEFLGPINKDSVKIEANSLEQLSQILKKDTQICSWLENCAVAVNDTIICSKDVALKDGDRVSLLPPVCGG